MSVMIRPLAGLVLALSIGSGNAWGLDTPLFRYQGLDYTAADLAPGLRQSLFELEQQHHAQLAQLAELALLELYLDEEAARQGLDRDTLAARLLAVPPPTEAAIVQTYEQYRAQIGAPLEQARARIVQHLNALAMQQRRNELIAELKAKGEFELALRQPEPPVVAIDTAGFPRKGRADAPVTLVEFADYQCPHCRDAVPEVKKLLELRGDAVQVVYIDFPINPSGVSRRVAEGGVCAQAQDRFWDYHDLAFERQAKLNFDSPTALAAELGLDLAAFGRCLDAPETTQRVARGKAEGARIGVDSTPTLYLNGRRALTDDADALAAEVDALLAKMR